ncbi:MAG TPA: MHYT domain-containing protein, partial [Acetobacteraceae bacterium]|nr:MHYT domain-containing protein [Acetobacteraceae bacterium]
MYTVLTVLLTRHDLRLVALAAFVCALSAFAGISLLTHARRTSGGMQKVWLAIAAFAVGFGIWATHFVAVLAFSSGIPTGYDIPETLVSLGIAVSITGGGLGIAAVGKRWTDALLGGAVVGVGISAMHYVGMAALLLGGRIAWSPPLVATSILFGIIFGAAALFLATWRPGFGWQIAGTGVLTLAICAMHFTAMGAADFSGCYAVIAPGNETPLWLSGVVAVISTLIIGFALGGAFLDVRERERTLREADRMRGLADAAVEGLLVCADREIITANASFLALTWLEAVEGLEVTRFLSPATFSKIVLEPNEVVETELLTASGQHIPVEVILREVDFAGRLRHAIAIRDLSARKQAEQHIRFLAHHDALTGLPNRASFNRQ